MLPRKRSGACSMICDVVYFAHAVGRLDSWQQRTSALAITVAVIKKFIDDGVDQLGVQVAYWDR